MKNKQEEAKINYIEFKPPIISIGAKNIQDEFLYGKTQEKLSSKQIKGSVTTSTRPVFGNASYNTTGNQSITGIGFQPSMVKITANKTGTNGNSIGYSNGGAGFCIYWYANTNTSTGNYILIVSDNGGNGVGRATISSMDADGFTLNWATCTGTINYIYECYP